MALSLKIVVLLLLGLLALEKINAADTAPVTTVGPQDHLFMVKAAQASHAEIAAGKLAAQKGSTSEIRRFGEMMAAEHGKTYDELSNIAKAKGVMLPIQPDEGHQKLIKQLQSLENAEFDRLYVREAGINDHQVAVDLFLGQTKNGTDAELRAFAEKTLPVIKQHLKMAQELIGSSKARNGFHDQVAEFTGHSP